MNKDASNKTLTLSRADRQLATGLNAFRKKNCKSKNQDRTARQLSEWERPGPTAAITITIMRTTQREHILLVELLHTEHAHAHSTNGTRSLCVVIVLVIAAVGPGLQSPHTFHSVCSRFVSSFPTHYIETIAAWRLLSPPLLSGKMFNLVFQ